MTNKDNNPFRSPESKRDAEWISAFGVAIQNLHINSKLEKPYYIPIIPDPKVFYNLFEDIRKRAIQYADTEMSRDLDEMRDVAYSLARSLGVEPGEIIIDLKSVDGIIKDVLEAGTEKGQYKTREEWGEPLDRTIVGLIFDLRRKISKLKDTCKNWEKLYQEVKDRLKES